MAYELINNPFAQATNEVLSTYGHNVSVVDKAKSLHKFGQRADVGTTKVTVFDITGVNDESFLSSNLIDTISSGNAGNTQLIVIEGHTVDGDGNFTFVVQNATLNGQTKVPLVTPLARVSRLANIDSTNFVASSRVYCYQDTAIVAGVPTDTSKIHIETTATNNQSTKASTTLSSKDYLLLSFFNVSVRRNSGTPEVEFSLEVREKGGVFRTRFVTTASHKALQTQKLNHF